LIEISKKKERIEGERKKKAVPGLPVRERLYI
jgi:hypothetical protein